MCFEKGLEAILLLWYELSTCCIISSILQDSLSSIVCKRCSSSFSIQVSECSSLFQFYQLALFIREVREPQLVLIQHLISTLEVIILPIMLFTLSQVKVKAGEAKLPSLLQAGAYRHFAYFGLFEWTSVFLEQKLSVRFSERAETTYFVSGFKENRWDRQGFCVFLNFLGIRSIILIIFF